MKRPGKCGGGTPDGSESMRPVSPASRALGSRRVCAVPKSIRRHDLALYLLFADLVAQAMIVSRAYEAGKKRVRRQGLRFQFGVRLGAQEPGVVGKLDHLDEFSV